MDQRDAYCSNRHKNDNFEGDTRDGCDGGSVPPREREKQVLEFLEEHGIALPPAAIYRGLKVERDITFSYSTVGNILGRLEEEGQVMRVDKDALDEGDIEPLSPDDTGRRTYYFITDAGRERLAADE